MSAYRSFQLIAIVVVLVLVTGSLSRAQGPSSQELAESAVAGLQTSLSAGQKARIQAVLAKYEPEIAQLLQPQSAPGGQNPALTARVYLPELAHVAGSVSAQPVSEQHQAVRSQLLLSRIQAELGAILSSEQQASYQQGLAAVTAETLAAAQAAAAGNTETGNTLQANSVQCGLAARYASLARFVSVDAAGYAYINYVFLNNSVNSYRSLVLINLGSVRALSAVKNLSGAYVNLITLPRPSDDLGVDGRIEALAARAAALDGRNLLLTINNPYARVGAQWANQVAIYSELAANNGVGCQFVI